MRSSGVVKARYSASLPISQARIIHPVGCQNQHSRVVGHCRSNWGRNESQKCLKLTRTEQRSKVDSIRINEVPTAPRRLAPPSSPDTLRKKLFPSLQSAESICAKKRMACSGVHCARQPCSCWPNQKSRKSKKSPKNPGKSKMKSPEITKNPCCCE